MWAGSINFFLRDGMQISGERKIPKKMIRIRFRLIEDYPAFCGTRYRQSPHPTSRIRTRSFVARHLTRRASAIADSENCFGVDVNLPQGVRLAGGRTAPSKTRFVADIDKNSSSVDHLRARPSLLHTTSLDVDNGLSAPRRLALVLCRRLNGTTSEPHDRNRLRPRRPPPQARPQGRP